MARRKSGRGGRPHAGKQTPAPPAGAVQEFSGVHAAKRDWGRATFWLTLAGVIVAAVVAVGCAYWGLRAVGAFDKNDVSLELDQDLLDQAKIAQVFVAVNAQFNAEDRVLVPVRLRVKNTGEKVLSNVRLTLQYAAKGHVVDLDMDQFMENHGTLMPGDSTEKTNAIGEDGEVYTNFVFGRLNVNQSRSIEYALQADEPDFRVDKVLPTVRQVAVKVLLQADGVPQKSFRLNYNVVPDDGFDALVGSYRRLYFRMGKALLDQDSYTDYLLSADYGAVMTPSGRLVLPRGNFKEGKAVVKLKQ